MDAELCFFLEVRLGTERTATIHKMLTEQDTRADRFSEFKSHACYTDDDHSFWRGPYWSYTEAIAYSGVHGWEPVVCDTCFPKGKDEYSTHQTV